MKIKTPITTGIRTMALLLMSGLLTTGCSDDLVNHLLGTEDNDNIVFAVSVSELANEENIIGPSARAGGSDFVSHGLKGWNSQLEVHRMPIPVVGIHPNTATASMTVAGTTRASVNDIAGNGTHFHDSLSVWGYTSKGRTLFDNHLQKKVRGWRTSVHWPYDKELTGPDDGKENPEYMRFYAIAPALESMEDLRLNNTPAYNQQPTFHFEVSNNIHEQRDLLYGESTVNTNTDNWGAIDVQQGPDGSITADPKNENLGQDNKIVKLRFYHILTAIRFAQGKMPVGTTVKNITLTAIKNSGNYTPGNNAIGSWSSQTGNITYTINANQTIDTYAPENVYIDHGNVMFLMPHTLDAAATLTIVLNDGVSDHTVSCSLNGDVWLPGYTVTYKLSVGKLREGYYLVVEPSSDYDSSVNKTVPVENATSTTTETKKGMGADSYEGTSSQSGHFFIHSFRNSKDYSQGASGVNVFDNVGWQVVGFADTNDNDYTTATYTPNNTNAKLWVSALTGWNASCSDPDEVQAEQPGGMKQEVLYTMNSVSGTERNHATILSNNNNVTEGFNLSTNLPNGSSLDGDKMPGYSYDHRSLNIYNSANSYIVNAQGTYRFPLVYGNSYQNGVARTLSMNTLVDHAGHAIRHANILEQVNSYEDVLIEDRTTYLTTEEQAAGGETKKRYSRIRYGGANHTDEITLDLIWQDVSGLFTVNPSGFVRVPTESETGFANFTVNSANLQPGNGVIALKGRRRTIVVDKVFNGSGTLLSETVVSSTTADQAHAEILWTWHIWVTDEVYPNSDASSVASNYPQYDSNTASKIPSFYDAGGVATGNRILPVNLGWVPDNMSFSKYDRREIWVKIKQTESEEVIYFKLCREVNQQAVSGTSTIYQWGRPTALPMTKHLDASNRTLYNASSALPSSTFTATVLSPQDAIMSPTKAAVGWNPATNYWSESSKTLYDPCPPGFRMPGGSVFTTFSLTGSDVSSGNGLNAWPAEGFISSGGYFYTTRHTTITQADRYGPKVYLPLTGIWSDSYTQSNTNKGYGWTGVQGSHIEYVPSSSSAGFFKFNETTLNTSHALPVRARSQ